MKLNKKIIAIIATFSIMFGSIPASASQVIKHNSPCRQINQIVTVKDVTYRCAVIGKKRVWKAISKASLPSTASSKELSKFNAWSENFKITLMIDAAHSNFTKWQKENSVTGGTHGSVVQDGILLDLVNTIKASHFFAVNTFKKYSPEKTVIIIGSSRDWVTNSSKNTFMGQVEYPNNNGHLCYPPNSQIIVACPSSHGTFYVVPNDNDVSSRLGTRALAAHEYFHVVQIHLAKINYRQFYNKVPAWFIEGSCDFVGYLSASPRSTDYINQRPQMFSGPSLNDFDLSKYNNNNGALYPYDIGRAAIEYLVASKGFQPVMDTFIEIGNGQSFEQAFEKSFEIKLIDFYDKFKNISKNVNGLVK